MRVKKEITKFCIKHSIKVNLLVELNREKYIPKNKTSITNFIFTKLKL